MIYTSKYNSPLGDILLAADEIGMCGLWFDGQKYFAQGLSDERTECETAIIAEAKRWLDVYFAGKQPSFTPPLHPVGSPFRQAVWQILLQIPYGQTITYGDIAKQLAKKLGVAKCPHKPSVALSGTTKSPSLFRVTALSVQTEA